jgi:hypothetical protein
VHIGRYVLDRVNVAGILVPSIPRIVLLAARKSSADTGKRGQEPFSKKASGAENGVRSRS